MSTKKDVNECVKVSIKKFCGIVLFFLLLIIITSCFVSESKESLLKNLPMVEFVVSLWSLNFLDSYINVKKIRTYMIKNNLNVEKSKIIYWNKRDIVLTQNYMFFVLTKNYMFIKNQKKRVIGFPYTQIEKIGKEVTYNARLWNSVVMNTYLFVQLKNGNKYRIFLFEGKMDSNYKKMQDFSPILLEKNNKIEIAETIEEPWYKCFTK